MTIGTTIFVPKFLSKDTVNTVSAVNILKHCMNRKQFILFFGFLPPFHCAWSSPLFETLVQVVSPY